ncbi:pyridoxamine 5'-phosphate oxidase family protein [Candidatus Saccharibacteria bacterium]|nr:pyridoxamine 5'-phosphate oxidase family protein [Candidatus Saccharibacteria bacterium]
MKPEEVLEFINGQRLAVIATVDEGSQPEAAVLEFGELDDFTIVIDAFESSRKIKNMQSNNKVAVVIGWDGDITVQLEGTAHKLEGEELKRAKTAYFAKNPRAKKWENTPGIVYFAIKPHWVRYSDLNQHPWFVKEFDMEPK